MEGILTFFAPGLIGMPRYNRTNKKSASAPRKAYAAVGKTGWRDRKPKRRDTRPGMPRLLHAQKQSQER